jgi:hypothetical protein
VTTWLTRGRRTMAAYLTDDAQTWRIVPAGDSGQFNLQGPYGDLTVDGRTGLQTLRFDR